jgi:hypothetical protein
MPDTPVAIARSQSGWGVPPVGAERSSAFPVAILARAMPTRKRHFVPGQLQFLTCSTYRARVRRDVSVERLVREAPQRDVSTSSVRTARRHPQTAKPTVRKTLTVAIGYFQRPGQVLPLKGLGYPGSARSAWMSQRTNSFPRKKQAFPLSQATAASRPSAQGNPVQVG